MTSPIPTATRVREWPHRLLGEQLGRRLAVLAVLKREPVLDQVVERVRPELAIISQDAHALVVLVNVETCRTRAGRRWGRWATCPCSPENAMAPASRAGRSA